MKKTLDYLIKILPSGNASEFPLIDEQLKKRKINFESIGLKSGGRVYRIPKNEEDRLPSDEKGPYLPVTEGSGHSLSLDKDNHFWEEYQKENGKH